MKLLAAILLLAVLAAAYTWWRSLRRQRAGYIDSYPYHRYLDRRLAARRPELSEAQRKLVFGGLREYFQLCRMARGHLVAMPSQAVDDAWHEFILFTRQYQRFCGKALGRFLHHMPVEAMSSPTRAQDGIKRAWRLSCLREGINPKAPRNLPLLFGMDAMLGLHDGFHYRLDCMAGGPAGATNGAAFCASHIACGGGCSGASGGCTAAEGTSAGDGAGEGGGCGGGD